jgi:hypothetical protein
MVNKQSLVEIHVADNREMVVHTECSFIKDYATIPTFFQKEPFAKIKELKKKES